MWIDPIVEEVRKAGEELAKKANYDLHKFFQNLRDNEKKRESKVVSKSENNESSNFVCNLYKDSGSGSC